jgi:predicted ATP-dependent endonuclease of OLD family
MKISHLVIKNFKTFDEEGISLSLMDLSALVGENSTGKSNVLEALDLFFNFSKSKMTKRSFHYDDVSNDITIEVTFNRLTPDEIKIFRVHLDGSRETLTITQKISLKLEQEQESSDIDETDYEFIESKHGIKWNAEEQYAWARFESKKPTKMNIKKWWKSHLKIGEFDFKELFDASEEPTPETYQDKLEQLWDEHFEIIPKEKTVGDDKVLGWKNILKGNLPKFFYVPAVKYVEEDFKVLKTNPFGEMISWLTKNISDEIRNDFQEKTKTIVEEAFAKIDKDEEGESKIAFINERLNSNLGINLDCKLELKFGTPSVSDIIFPSAQLYANDGYDSEITLKGHGLQRLSMFSLLRTYNDLRKKIDKRDKNIIVAIEEPEIYLHPPIERATYKLLRSLSEDDDQIIYSTHDSHFVAVEYFDEIRLFKKELSEKPRTFVHEFSVNRLIQLYKDCYGKAVDEKSLRHRFGHICDYAKNEGFFAKKIILTEGETEKYSLPIYFAHKGFDLDNERIAIISAGSVDNILYLYVIFNEFHIPCYIIFDGDKPSEEFSSLEGEKRKDVKNKSNRNKELLSFAGETIDESLGFVFPATVVKDKYAVWEINFETTFHKSLDNYEGIKKKAKELYGTDSKPLTGRFFADELTTEFPEKIDTKFQDLITKIKNCQWTKSCLVD